MISASQPTTSDWLHEARRRLLDGNPTADHLYRHWFHRETGRSVRWPTAALYRTAMLRPQRFEGGWRVVQTADAPAGAVLAMRGGRQRMVAPPEMVPDDPRCLAPGRGTALRVDPLTSGESGGFWHVWSAGWQVSAPKLLQRIYLRIDRAHALLLAVRLTDAAPVRQTWALKIQCDTHDSGRRDSSLIYLPADTRIDSGWFPGVVEAVSALCLDDLPPFVRVLAPGVGHAPDPGDARSFGQALCDAVSSAAELAPDADRFMTAATAAIRSLPRMDATALPETHP